MIPTQIPHDVGVRALEWLAAHRDHFRFRFTEDDALDLARLKPVGELAVIGSALFREGVAGSRQSALARELLDFAWRDVLDGGAALARIQRDEPLSPMPLEVYTPFKELGLRNPEVERRAAATRSLASWAALEVQPTRRLGLSVTEERAGHPPSLDVAEATRRTWLGQTPEPWTLSFHLAYDVTHAVFHLTRWGARPEALPPGLAAYLDLWLPAWLEDWAERGHWDLLGELLVVDACLPRPTLDEAAWRSYAAAQDRGGAMPVEGGMPDAPDDAALFDQLHHPTLVAAFASVMATSRSLAALPGSTA
ncbi:MULTISPECIES: DUF6895 family protein [unclassified Streptomyces]|uniref:DUF6895 family protein n=1 Tax=unclassified Streptomyces TaxID=2593676 RepID=UPI0022B5F132|nr:MULTISPECIES: hypothetical protein [unclassified Streptomyces]MCZ7414903.1 hypothetical protein [Streptomyces sp. WMMC897]MCZ7431846.1 hypothetical protein [Streptomyces sp. WMMC1477]